MLYLVEFMRTCSLRRHKHAMVHYTIERYQWQLIFIHTHYTISYIMCKGSYQPPPERTIRHNKLFAVFFIRLCYVNAYMYLCIYAINTLYCTALTTIKYTVVGGGTLGRFIIHGLWW